MRLVLLDGLAEIKQPLSYRSSPPSISVARDALRLTGRQSSQGGPAIDRRSLSS